jgi:hypothetical protein
VIDPQELYDALSMPFPSEMIDWRVGSTRAPWDSEIQKGLFKADDKIGKPLAYVDARTVMDRLDQVCGIDGWQCNYTPGVNGSIVCNLGILIAGDWIWKADGAGATDFEGEKGALSDALKRAAVRFGVSRYLYDLKAPDFALYKGKSLSKETLAKLEAIHDDFANKAGWGMRAGVQAYKLLNQVVKDFVTDQASAADFREKNKGMIPQLPVAMRRHLMETLDRVGAATSEAAE